MTPDDPRHGTSAGHNSGCRCAPCCAAKLSYDKRRRLDEIGGRPRTLPGWRVARRIEALQAMGWSLRRFADEAGVTHNNLSSYAQTRRVTTEMFAKIDAAYQRLSMSLPPQRDRWERQGVARARAHAGRHGFAPPLAWDNIDDPDEIPSGFYRPLVPTDPTDFAAVHRILGGDWRLRCTPADKAAVVARWAGDLNQLERLTGWNVGRYMTKEGAA